jgi:pyruvate dehydrogenase E1 component beta subunit
MNYRTEIMRGMKLLAEQSNAIFLGQGVRYPAHAISKQIAELGLPDDRKLELPVFENTQLGMAMGMAMAGMLPICVVPRINFLLCATDQLVNHLDKYEQMTGKPIKVIIVTQTGATEPLDPGPQHSGNYCHALDQMLTNIPVVDLCGGPGRDGAVYEEFVDAVESDGSTVLVQQGDLL